MDMPQETNRHVEAIAGESLSQFEKISTAAEKARLESPPPGAGVFASMNTMTSGSAVRNLGEINQGVLDSYQVLSREPAIARVKVVSDEGELKTYYICRTTPISGIDELAGYLSPIGRLASLPIGDALVLKNGRALEVVESAKLHPLMIDEAWDSKNTIIEGDSFGPITIKSLRALLNRITSTGISEDLLDQIRAEETQKKNVIEGMRRSVISKMGLRDQPILDQHQDEIFRLPLEAQLLILGPPGTGKTTTLIRRLGQKLDAAYLDEDEKRIIESISLSNTSPHPLGGPVDQSVSDEGPIDKNGR